MNKFKKIKKICQQRKDINQEALAQELDFIKEKNLINDFYELYKQNKAGKENKINSLVAYALGITSKKPTSAFSPNKRLRSARVAPPDIDLDFADHRRDEVIDYVRKKYGEEHVAQIITFGTMAARAAVRDSGRALGVPLPFCDKISKTIPALTNLKNALENIAELKQLYQTEAQAKKLLDVAQKLEGVARHASTHACGVVITDEPLDNLVPRQHPTQNDQAIVTQYEMHSIEDLGLLKMDFLGLKNLTVIENTVKAIKKRHNIKIDFNKISLFDKKTFELLQEAKTTGVFQLECLTGDTIVSNTTIEKLYQRKDKKILESVYLDEGRVHKNKIRDVFYSGKKDVFILIAENNWYIKTTKNHHFLTEDGWKKLGDINLGEKILTKKKARHLVYNTCQTCGKQIGGQKEGKSNFCYKCSAKFYRNPSKKESRAKIRTARIKFYQQGGKPWNYGFTVENNEIWRKTTEKISKALQGRTFEDLYGPQKAKELKQKLSKNNKGSRNPMFGKPAPHRRGGFRKDLGHYVRSSWESDFARILRLHRLKYQYEPKTFKLLRVNGEILHYTPDFYVPSKNTFYEIKGWLHDLDQEKINLFQEQYPQYGFILINTTKFAEFALEYKDLINWECPQIPVERSFCFVKIKQIKYCGKEKTYDITMKTPGNNFVANGFLVHNSNGMKRYLKQLEPTSLEDIIAMVSLYRPGPMDLIPDFIARKHGQKKIKYLHPKLKPILKNTYGIAVYQEQVLQIARDLAGFTLGEADVLRKAVGKKIKELLASQKDKFVQGCVKNKISRNIAEKLFSFIEPFARYGFNRAHAAAYAMIGYYTAYLKAHWPTEFMASLLTCDQQNIDRVAIDIEECKNLGIEILAPDVNESKEYFNVIADKTIRFGLKAIKNVGHNVVEDIVQKALFKSLEDFVEKLEPKNLNKKSIEALTKAGALDRFSERNRLLENIDQILTYGREMRKAKEQGQSSLFSDDLIKSSLKLEDAQPASKKKQLAWEKELLGLYVSEHPLEQYDDYFNQRAIAIKDLCLSLVGQDLRIGGVINKIKKIVTKAGQAMAFVELEDLTGRIEVIVFPRTFEQSQEVWQADKLVLIKGVLNNRDDSLKMICNGVEEVE